MSIAFDIRSGGKEFHPRLVIGKDQPGTLWDIGTGAHSFRMKVSWAQ